MQGHITVVSRVHMFSLTRRYITKSGLTGSRKHRWAVHERQDEQHSKLVQQCSTLRLGEIEKVRLLTPIDQDCYRIEKSEGGSLMDYRVMPGTRKINERCKRFALTGIFSILGEVVDFG